MKATKEQQERRNRILIRASWVSTVGNAILAVLKIAVGIVAGSLAVLGDGIDSATDVVISLVMVFTAKIVNRPPDSKYVYGYEKAEGIATKILSLVIFYAGIQILVSSVGSMFSTEPREMPTMIAIYVTLFSIVGKLLLALYQFRAGKKANSSLLTANAINMRNDVLLSVGVLVGLVFTFALKMPMLDSLTGIFVSLFILKSSIDIFLDSNVELMDGVKDPTIYSEIFNAVDMVEGAHNPHRVRTRMLGGMYIIDLDIETDGDIPLKEAHSIAHRVENKIRENIDNVYDVMIHVEPLGSSKEKEQFGVSRRTLRKIEREAERKNGGNNRNGKNGTKS